MKTDNRISKDDKEIEILLKYYEAARVNVITRLAARDNSILLYIGGVAGISAATFTGTNEFFEILLIIPPLSVGIAAFTAQHNYVMDSLYIYIAENICKRLKELHFNLDSWEVSNIYITGRSSSTGIRSWAEGIIIFLSALLSVIIYRSHASNGLLISIGFISCLVTIIISVLAFITAKNKHGDLIKAIERNNLIE